MPRDMLEAKFFDCAQHASLSLPRENLSGSRTIIDTIEQVDDIAIVPRLLVSLS